MTTWEVLSLIFIVGAIGGGIVFIGYIVLWFLGIADWMNRGSH